MGNCSFSGCATGLGITQIVIGVWFMSVIFSRYLSIYWKNQVTKTIFLASVSVLSITSGSLAIAGAQMTTTGLVTAAFVLSTLASLVVAFGLLIYCAKFSYDAANSHEDLVILFGAILFAGFVGVPALVMFIVATISAAHSGKVFFCVHVSFILLYSLIIVIIEIERWCSAAEMNPWQRSRQVCWPHHKI